MTNDELLKLITLQRQVEFQYKLDNFTDNSLGQIKRSIDKARNQVVDYITDRGEALTSWGGKRSTDILNEMDKLTFGIRGQLVDDISDISSIAGEKALEMHGDILSFGGRVAKFNTTLLSAAQLKSIVLNTPVGGNLLKDWVDRTFTTNLQESIKEDILAGMLRGKGYRGLINGVEEGFNNIGRREAITLTRTYVQSANVGAMESVYRDNADIVKKVKWSSTLEGGYAKSGRGTCVRCACLDGETYPIDDHPPCPLHPRCLYARTKIYTSKGWVEIRNIEVGDLVLTHKKRFKKVTSLMKDVRYDNMVRIFAQGRPTILAMTSDHPVFINDKWVEAKYLEIGDKINILAGRCLRCNKKILYHRKYCENCLNIEITKKANEKTRQLAKEGKLNFQQEEAKQLIRERNRNDLAQRKRCSERMKKNNPSCNPKVRKKMTKTFKKTMLEDPDRNGNRVLALRGGFASNYEKKFDRIIKTFGIIYERQYPILNYFVDFAIPSLKIVIEIDGEHHKYGNARENDEIRASKIEGQGWIVIRFLNSQLKNNKGEIEQELKRIIKNHNGKYEFIEVEITKIEKWRTKKRVPLYNFSVEEDESYIAKGFVVHNCRCSLLPQTVSYKELGLDMDEVRDVYRPYTIRPSETIDAGRRKQIIEVGFEKGNYADFYASRGKKFQQNVVGPVRQDLISDGDIGFKDLVNLKTGRLLRLDELGFTRSGELLASPVLIRKPMSSVGELVNCIIEE